MPTPSTDDRPDECTDLATTLAVQLGRIVRVLRQEGTGVPFGPGSTSALVTLARHREGMRLGELAEAEGIAPPTLTRIVKALERDGYVARTRDPDDGRAQRVALTPEGRTVITAGTTSRIAALRRRLASLPEDDRRRIEAALPALEALLDLPASPGT